jgi:hypothetical protein
VVRDLPPLPEDTWRSSVERWLSDQLVPVAPDSLLGPGHFAGHERALEGALAEAENGTRAEAERARQALGACAHAQAPAKGRALCLAPLVEGTILVSETKNRPTKSR